MSTNQGVLVTVISMSALVIDHKETFWIVEPTFSNSREPSRTEASHLPVNDGMPIGLVYDLPELEDNLEMRMPPKSDVQSWKGHDVGEGFDVDS